MLVISGYIWLYIPIPSPFTHFGEFVQRLPGDLDCPKSFRTEMDEIPQPTSQVSRIAETTETATEATASCRVGEQGGTGHRGGR